MPRNASVRSLGGAKRLRLNAASWLFGELPLSPGFLLNAGARGHVGPGVGLLGHSREAEVLAQEEG